MSQQVDRIEEINQEPSTQEPSTKKEYNKKGHAKGGKNKVLSVILFFVIAAVIGFGIGALIGTVAPKSMGNALNGIGFLQFLFIMIYIIAMIFVVSFIHILVHETGHMICGFLSGYEFVFFTIGSFTLYQKDGKWHLGRYQIPGAGGQCIMRLKEGKPEKFFLYNMGGAIANFILAFVSLVVVLVVHNFFLAIPFTISVVIGVLYALLNGIPMKLSGTPNDGYNGKELGKDENAAKAFQIQLNVASNVKNGIRYAEMNLDQISLPEDAPFGNVLNCAAKQYELYYHMDRKEWNQVRSMLAEGADALEQLPSMLQYEWNVERLYMALMDGDRVLINQLYTKELKQYMANCKYLLSKKRTEFAYEVYGTKNQTAAKQAYLKAMNLAKVYAFSGEIAMELDLIAAIKKDYDKLEVEQNG